MPSLQHPVPVIHGNPVEFEARLRPMEDKLRKRAYELFCERSHEATPEDDWTRAEHEMNLLHLSGVSDEGEGFRITGSVPCDCTASLAIDAFPSEIVVESLKGGRLERYTRFRLPGPIDTSKVHAHLNGLELEVMAPKAAA
ncbi:MAG: Hsp20/alpha crystallin family protein [Acidobacteriota bacterium]|nr:Hsp20/alpha crystallin family protein [Acidobacteriota bacterium]